MAVHRSQAQLLAPDGVVIGEGRAYLHLRQPEAQPQPAQGTLSLDWWDEAAAPARLRLANGPLLDLQVDSDHLSGCVVGRILRYQTTWPGTATE